MTLLVLLHVQLSQECLVEEPADYTRSSEEDGSEIASDEDGLIRKARCVCIGALHTYPSCNQLDSFAIFY